MFVPACDRPSVAKAKGPQARSVMETRSTKIHRKMPAPPRQLPITGFAHKAAVVGNGGVTARRVCAARNMPAEGRRPAALDGVHYLQLGVTEVALIGTTPSRAVIAEDLRDLQRWTAHV